MSELEWCTSKSGHDWHVLSENRREHKSRCRNCGITNVEKMNGPLVIVSMCVYQDHLFVATPDGVFERCDDGVFRECRFERSPE